MTNPKYPLQMVIVVKLGGIEERHVVAAMVDDGDGHAPVPPEPAGGQMGGAQGRTEDHRDTLCDEVLHRVGVNRHDADRSGPFVVKLVAVLVDSGVVVQPEEGGVE